MTYDSLGQRVRFCEHYNSSTTQYKNYLWAFNNIAEERSESFEILRTFYAFGEKSAEGACFYSRDSKSTVSEAINNEGQIVSCSVFTPFGIKAKGEGAFLPFFSYCGYAVHERADLLISRTRFYYPRFGRWLNRDPITERGGLNLHSYVSNSPIFWYDPSGLGELGSSIGGSIGGAIGAGIGGCVGGRIGSSLGGGLGLGLGTYATPGAGNIGGAAIGAGLGGAVGTGAGVALGGNAGYNIGRAIGDKAEDCICAMGKKGERNPLKTKGKPNSTEIFDRQDGGRTIREYDNDGNAKTDYDWGHSHGQGDPHKHQWDWTSGQPTRGPGEPW